MYQLHQRQVNKEQTKTAHDHVSELKDDPSYEQVKSLAVVFKSAKADWIDQFLDAGGVSAFAMVLANLCRFEERPEEDAQKVEIVLDSCSAVSQLCPSGSLPPPQMRLETMLIRPARTPHHRRTSAPPLTPACTHSCHHPCA